MFTKAEHRSHYTQHTASHTSQVQPSFGQTEHQDQFISPQQQQSPFIGATAFIQPKLSISQPGDPYEKEADATADKVMRMPEAPVSLSQNKEEEIQRKEEEQPEAQELGHEAPVVQLKTEEEEIQREEEEETLEEDLEPFEPIQMKAEADQEEEKEVPSHSLIHRSAISSARSQQASSATIGHHTAKVGLTAHTPSRPRYTTMHRMGRAPPVLHTPFQQSLQATKGGGSALDSMTGSFMESRFGADFSGVRVHTNTAAIHLASSIKAHAFTHGNDIYFNAGRYRPDTDAGRHLLAHELTHTIQQNASPSIKPFLKTSNQGIYSSSAAQQDPVSGLDVEEETVQPLTIQKSDDNIRPELQKAVAYAKSQMGKVNAKEKDNEGKRVGWERLLEYFRTAMGEDKITPKGAPYKTGDVNEEQILYYSMTKTDVMVPDPKTKGTKMDKRDVMPSWCGIFVFWALNKGGVPMNKWALGKSAVDLKSAYPPKYIPQKGDIAYKGPPYMHYAIVDKSEPEGETNPSKVRVTTINGNTAGQDNLGGQVASSTDPLSAWTAKGGFFNPLYGKEDQLPKNPSPVTEKEIEQIIAETTAIAKDAATRTPARSAKSKAAEDKPEVNPSSNKVDHELLKSKVQTEEAPAEEAPAPALEKVPESPKTAAEDPGFQKVLQGVGQAHKKQKAHDTPETKAAQAQAAAMIPTDLDINSQAQKNQVGVMNKQQPKPFNAQAFKEQLMERIKAALPKDDNEAVDRYENPSKQTEAMEEAKGEAKGDVKKEKENAGKAISDASAATPSTVGIEAKEVVGMKDEDPGKKPYVPNAETAAPKPRTDEEISMEKDAQALDDQMAKDNVTEAQLEKSNEPTFTGALDNKREAQKEARNAPAEYRAQEQPRLENAEQQSKMSVYGKLKEMHDARSGQFGLVDANKKDTKDKDEKKRTEIAEKLQSIYKATKDKVDTKLNDLEKAVTEDFDTAATAANKVFEKNVNDRLDDHYGMTTVDDTVGDYLRGSLSPEIDRIFQSEKKTFIQSMDTAITDISVKVETGLNEAMDIIATGKLEVDDYWSKLDPEMQKIGATAKEEIMGKFTQLEQSVQEKNDQLVDKLQARYVENVNKLQETFDKIKESKKGWLSGAIDAIAGVIKAILQLKDMLFETLARVAHVIGEIISDPIGFLGNLIKAVMMGLNMFIENLPKHLKKGLIEWLMGAMPPGIVLPEVWDLKGIFGFVMQVLGLTWANIRQRAVLKLGEPTVAALETTFDIFQIIIKEGIAGLWKFILDKVGNLQVLIMDTIKNYLVEKIITAGIEWIVGLLNPAAAFIKACKLIYSIVMFFVERGKQIMALVNAVIDSVENIVKGDLVGAAKMVETALAKLIPVTIGFLAALLGLNGITAEVQKIIKKIQAPINKAIDWVIDKAIALAKKLGIDKIAKKVKGKVEDTKKWAKDKAEKGKEWAKEKAESLLQWLGLKRSFKSEDGEDHKLYFEGTETNATMMVASTPQPIELFLASKKAKDPHAATAYKYFINTVKVNEKDVEDKGTRYLSIDTKKKKQKRAARHAHKKAVEALRDCMKVLADKLQLVTFDAKNANLKVKTVVEQRADSSHRAVKVKAMPLTYLPSDKGVGSDPQEDPLSYANYAKKSTDKWVRGHMLSEHLHGPGLKWNLVPVIQTVNSNMATIEALMMPNLAKQGEFFYYETTAKYDDSRTDPDAKNIPESVTIKYGEAEKKGDSFKVKAGTSDSKTFTQGIPKFGKMGPPNINTMSRDDLRIMFADVVNYGKVFDTRRGLAGQEFDDIKDLETQLKKAYGNSKEFKNIYWPLIRQKFKQKAFVIEPL